MGKKGLIFKKVNRVKPTYNTVNRVKPTYNKVTRANPKGE